MSEGRVAVGHPVDVGSGAVFTLSTDFRIPGSLELRWQRRYSTAAERNTWLGVKWTVPYFMSLRRLPDRYILDGPHGEEVTFSASAGRIPLGAVVANLSANMELRREAHHYSVLHWHSGGDISRFCFQASDEKFLALAWIENLAGHRIRLEYDSAGQPVRVLQELERRLIEIEYDGAGLISAIYFLGQKGPKLLVRYEFDGSRRLIAAVDAMGYRKGYEYDTENRLIAESNPLGSRFVFKYDRLGRCTRTAGDDGFRERKLQYLKEPPMTRVTEGNGAVTQYYLNQAGQVIQIVDPVGGVTTNTFDEHGRLVGVTRPNGSKESHAYDDKGNRAASVDPCGAKTTVEHNELHVPVRLVDRNGNTWKLPNKYEGSLAGMENLPRRLWDYSWDSRGLVAQVRSPGGWTIYVRRDEHFRWQETSDQTSVITHTEFDEFGYATQVLDAEGVVSRTSYDDLHRPVEILHGASDVTRYHWDAVGRMTERIGPGYQHDTWRYDKYGDLVAQTNSLGDTALFEYDKEGRLMAIANQVGERLEYRRDELGRITVEKLFDGRTQTYEYDLSGRQVMIHLSDGRTVKQTFDAAGRLLCRKASDGLVDEFAYDKEGRAIKAWNGHSTVEFKRDRFGRIVAEVQNGRKIRYRYNADGKCIGRSLPFAVLGCKVTRVFDQRGRLLALQDEQGPCQEFRWDNVDRLVGRLCAGDVSERFLYDNQRRLQEQRVQARDGHLVRAHSYDASGNLARLEDDRKETANYSYDRLNRLIEVRIGRTVAEAYAYDANQAILRTHRGPRGIAPGGKALQDGSRDIFYGEDGAVAEIRSGASVWSLKHDVNGRLVKVELPNGTVIRYEYDPFGRRTATVISEKRTEFLWEVWALAVEVRGGSPQTIYNCAELRPLMQWKSGRRLTPILDRRGAVQNVFDESGQECWSCDLDAYGNLLSEKGSAPSPFRLRGQYQDAETGFHYNFYRHYDPGLGDYTAPDPVGIAGGYHLYAYPRNPLRWDDPFGLECGDPEKHEDDPKPPAEPPEEVPPGTPEEPDPRAAIEKQANDARGQDPQPNTVARLENDDGSIVTGQSGGGKTRDPVVQEALDNVPESRQSPYHGSCAEIDAMSNNAANARANGENPATANEGALIQTAQVRGAGGDQSRQGAPQTPCPSCQSVMNQLGAGYNPR